ncbi:MAG TPA: cobyrinate a,c-diamide synthase, partial [Nitrospirae bacterium]|nr:cobyrinate a,c-diamide synthase [Nitrospirota bacterium]
MSSIPRIVIAAPGRSSGKTTLAMGLCRAFKKKGLAVQPFKKGPDYIDPMWLTSAAGVECRNLDFHMMGDENILRAFQTASKNVDIAVIEGNMGLYDGLDLEGSDSTAGLAHFLRSPVILVIDTTGMNRSAAALLLGYRQFDPELNIAGVILNRVSGSRHESKMRKSIERHVGMNILGALPKAPDDVGLTERHLGLIPVKEDPSLASKIAVIGEMIERSLDLESIFSIAKTA